MFNARLPITSTSITVTFPDNIIFSTPPIIQITIEGAATNVAIERNSVIYGDYGFIYKSVTLTFETGAVGHIFNMTVFPE